MYRTEESNPLWVPRGRGLQDPPRSAPAILLLLFTSSQLQSGKQGKKQQQKKQSCSHNGRHLVNNHNTCVLNSNYVSHQRRHHNAGNLSLHSRSFQCLFSHGRPAFPLSRQRCTACLKRLRGISFQRWMSWFLHLLAWPNVLFFVWFLIKGLK